MEKIIKINDIKEQPYREMVDRLTDQLIQLATPEDLMERFGADPYDPARVNGDAVRDYVEGLAIKELDKWFTVVYVDALDLYVNGIFS